MAVERDEKGRFVKGWRGGPGRPKRADEENYMEAMRTACTNSDWRKIVKKAVEQAKRGNHQARKFLADYLLGPPPQKVDLGDDVLIQVIGIDPDAEYPTEDIRE